MRHLGWILLAVVPLLSARGKQTFTGRITCHMCDFDTVKDAEGAPKEKPVGCYTVIVAKQKDKAARRAEKSAKKDRSPNAPGGIDPDIADIRPGPQPPAAWQIEGDE